MHRVVIDGEKMACVLKIRVTAGPAKVEWLRSSGSKRIWAHEMSLVRPQDAWCGLCRVSRGLQQCSMGFTEVTSLLDTRFCAHLKSDDLDDTMEGCLGFLIL